MTEQDFDTGISSEVFTVKSKTKLIDIFNSIMDKKASAVLDLFNGLSDDDIIANDDSIIIIGTYFTGIAIAKYLSRVGYSNICIVDIYSHLDAFIDSKIAESSDKGVDNPATDDLRSKIDFSTDLNLIYDSDIVIDTTGLGGINEEQSSDIHSKVFLIEDPIAEDNDKLLKEKNNIYKRLELVDSDYKYVLKTTGLDTKTSGTMTFSIDVLRQSINELLSKEGVLYCSAEMTFFEEIIFKEKDMDKFFNLIESPALKVSTINLFDIDEVINGILDKIDSKVLLG